MVRVLVLPSAAYAEGGLLADLVRLEDVPLSDLSPMSRFLFFPGDCALLVEPEKAIREEKDSSCASATCKTREDVSGIEVSEGMCSQDGVSGASDAGLLLSQDQMDKDKKVYLEVMAVSGLPRWGEATKRYADFCGRVQWGNSFSSKLSEGLGPALAHLHLLQNARRSLAWPLALTSQTESR